ncbi:MAG: Holliday junction helicase RuvA, holliday junction helicase RuvA [Candidatus Parcubacteria bacterium]|nr:Holliday junction helicase RuvA, holliday junction helicase RuvA [Candidatus Parcubacteria bacterium]
MIAQIKGMISDLGGNYAVVDINGLGYKVFTTSDALHQLKTGTESKFWTYLAVREDALDLYGFLAKKDKDFFELLIGVSGIGPKSALNILSLVSSDTLAGAIRTGSTAHLVKVSGIGRKTAEKIVLELKDKMGIIAASEGGEMAAGMSSDLDAIEALKALGYDADESRESLKRIPSDISDTGAKVKAALRLLGK